MFAGLQLYASRLIPPTSLVYHERGNVLRIYSCEPLMLPGGSPLHRGRLPFVSLNQHAYIPHRLVHARCARISVYSNFPAQCFLRLCTGTLTQHTQTQDYRPQAAPTPRIYDTSGGRAVRPGDDGASPRRNA